MPVSIEPHLPRLKNQGIIICAPPCSLFSPACASVHRRTFENPEGDQKVWKVRLAQRIWENMATGIFSNL